MKDRSVRRFTIMMIVFGIIIALLLCVAVYVHNYYHASDEALEAINSAADNVTVTIKEKKQITFMPQDSTTGIIFYPGGKVEYKAYAPLMKKLSDQGICCVLVHMPGNLAVFDSSAADDIYKQYPSIKHWYIAGHSLGGAMAASYASEHADQLDGLILLASYSTKDLSNLDLKVLSIYGSEDHVLSMDKYNENRSNLPSNLEEYIIEGGCHSYFGSYGMQKNDGSPTISNTEQISATVDYILQFINQTTLQDQPTPTLAFAS